MGKIQENGPKIELGGPKIQENGLELGVAWGFSPAGLGIRPSWLDARQRWDLLVGIERCELSGDLVPALAAAFTSEEQREHIAVHMESLVMPHYESSVRAAVLWFVFTCLCDSDPRRFVAAIDSPAKRDAVRQQIPKIPDSHKTS